MDFLVSQGTKWAGWPVRFAILVPLAASLCGCASQFPAFDNFLSTEPVTTGSITQVPAPFDNALTREDWLVAEPSLDAALDPSNVDASTDWTQKSGPLKGSFRPVGLAFIKNGALCRDFTALIEKKSVEPQLFAATACRFGAGPWQVQTQRLG